jgi:hypothetical protein
MGSQTGQEPDEAWTILVPVLFLFLLLGWRVLLHHLSLQVFLLRLRMLVHLTGLESQKKEVTEGIIAYPTC